MSCMDEKRVSKGLRGVVGKRLTLPARLPGAILCVLLLLTGCHGGTLDAVYPGTLGHDPPPAVNLPPQDQGMERL